MSRAIYAAFDTYQKARIQFVQTVAELANHAENISSLQSAGVMGLLRPLLLDNIPAIQQSAALALARLAYNSEELADAVVSNDILPHLVFSLKEQNRLYKKAAAFVLRAVARHSPNLAHAVVNSNALEALVSCLEEFDPAVREAAAWALAHIAKHEESLASAVVKADAIKHLVKCLEEPELSLKKIAATALGQICKHSAELAHNVVDADAVKILIALILHPDAPLKRQVCSCLSEIAKHNVDLAETLVKNQNSSLSIFPRILHCLKDQDMQVRKNAACCIREIARHTHQLATIIVNCGGTVSIVDYLSSSQGASKLPGIMTLGFIAAYDETLAMNVISAKAINPLLEALKNDEDEIKAAAAWTLGHIGRHSPDHSKNLAEANVPEELLKVYVASENMEDLRKKTKKALKMIIEVCHHLPALEPLLLKAQNASIQKYVIARYAEILPSNTELRVTFVKSGAFKRIQEINSSAASDTKLKEYINEINKLYPPDVVNYYSPDFQKNMMKKVDEYKQD